MGIDAFKIYFKTSASQKRAILFANSNERRQA